MNMQTIIKPLIQKNNTKIVMIVLDGVGGLPVNGRTELEPQTRRTLTRLQVAPPADCTYLWRTGLHPEAAPDISGYSDMTL